MSRVVVVGALPESLINFRGELLKALVAEGHEVTAMAAEAKPELIDQLANMTVNFKSFPVQRNGLNVLKDVQTCLALRNAFSELKPDVVLSYTIKPVVWGGIALKGLSGPRFYALVTGLGFAFQGGSYVRQALAWLVACLYRASLSRASRVIFQNVDNRDEFVLRQIVKEEKCTHVDGSGVDLERFAVEPFPDGKIVFLAIGRLLGEKGFREYARAAGMVKKRYRDVIFNLVGPTDPSPDGILLHEVLQWESEAGVKYFGTTDDVRPYLTGCHVYVLPSYHEGMPRTVLEAMATGRPILTTDVPGCRETVVPGKNGFLVPKASAEALAERMIWFIEHRELLQRMGQCSRQMAEERFDVNKINTNMLRIMGLSSTSVRGGDEATL